MRDMQDMFTARNNKPKKHVLHRVIRKQAKPSGGMVEKATVSGAIADVMIIAILVLVMFCSIIPLWHVLMASVSEGKRLIANDGLLLLPVGKPTFTGYTLLFADASIVMGYFNTIIYVSAATGIGMVLCILGGYVLSRKTKLRKPLTLIVTFTLLFSGGLIPSYMVNRTLGLVGTRWSLILPGATGAYFVVMMMNAFKSVPESMVEAARIDGAGHIRTMAQIMLPQCRSISAVVMLNSLVVHWNSWLPASIYVPNKRDLWPLQLWIRQIIADNEGLMQSINPDYNRYLIQYAIIIAASLPILLAFPFFQKSLETGIIAGGVKE